MFTQRHYKKIAQFMKELEYHPILKLHLRDELIKMFEEDNPLFKRDKFIKACGRLWKCRKIA